MSNPTTTKPQLLKGLSIFNGIEAFIMNIYKTKEVSLQQLIEILSVNVEGGSLGKFKYTTDTEETALDLVKTLHGNISSALNGKYGEFNVGAYYNLCGTHIFEFHGLGPQPLYMMEEYIRKNGVMINNPYGGSDKIMPDQIESVSIEFLDNYLGKKNVPMLTVHYDKEQNFARDRYVCPILRIALPKDPSKTFPQVYSTGKGEKIYKNKEFRRSDSSQALHGDKIREVIRKDPTYYDGRLSKWLGEEDRNKCQNMVNKKNLSQKEIIEIAQLLFIKRENTDPLKTDNALNSQIAWKIEYLTATMSGLKIANMSDETLKGKIKILLKKRIKDDIMPGSDEDAIEAELQKILGAMIWTEACYIGTRETMIKEYNIQIKNRKKIEALTLEYSEQFNSIIRDKAGTIQDLKATSQEILKKIFPNNPNL